VSDTNERVQIRNKKLFQKRSDVISSHSLSAFFLAVPIAILGGLIGLGAVDGTTHCFSKDILNKFAIICPTKIKIR